jgi:hypothetical protein
MREKLPSFRESVAPKLQAEASAGCSKGLVFSAPKSKYKSVELPQRLGLYYLCLKKGRPFHTGTHIAQQGR